MIYRKIAIILTVPVLAAVVALTMNRASSELPVWSPSGGQQAAEAGARQADSVLILVNKRLPLSADHEPGDLVVPDIPFTFEGDHEKKHLRRPAARAAESLFAAAKKEGIELFGVSGYRSYKTQNWLWKYNVKKKGESAASRYNAFPGMSEHQTGLALDVTSKSAEYSLTVRFGNTEEGIWLANNAHRFGFIVRYPQGKESITGYAYEPWHIRYVGVEAARTIHDRKLTLEEWADSAVPAGNFEFFPFNLF
ncbi:M15 family metallopeptidase [Paenibacillus alkalitolerans]|uniref:M15 family metallopeptidase n=1 Tax=Paenibacillus alkalitolerans TaxID=2799335 RepID=UPI0018F5D797|nr:M15 family metallopeptidase [Paenibacillus alkalitolerans]